jgi:hypothetical protein
MALPHWQRSTSMSVAEPKAAVLAFPAKARHAN